MFYSKKLRKFKKINHCFFSKKGGFSKGIYQSLNCGKGSRDNKKSMYKNLALIFFVFKSNEYAFFRPDYLPIQKLENIFWKLCGER